MTKVKKAVIKYLLVYMIHNYHEIDQLEMFTLICNSQFCELYMRVFMVSDPSELHHQSIADSDVLVVLKVSNIDAIAYFFLYVYYSIRSFKFYFNQ